MSVTSDKLYYRMQYIKRSERPERGLSIRHSPFFVSYNRLYKEQIYCRVAQLVEHRTDNAVVAGSNPAPTTTKK